jgi:tetratricopeptide (TPR) repeat protein
MNSFIALMILLLLFSCSSSDDLSIDFEDEDTTVEQIEAFADQMIEKGNYRLVDSSYQWIKIKNPNYYDNNIFLKKVELFGYEDRYEKQMKFYEDIFVSDSIDNSMYVPHFYAQIGISFYRRLRIKRDGQTDSTMATKAIEYLDKAFYYELYDDQRMRAASRYYAGLTYAELGDASKAEKMYSLILRKYKKSKFHAKAYFKSQEPSVPGDIVLTEDQKTLYRQTFNINESESIVDDNVTLAKPEIAEAGETIIPVEENSSENDKIEINTTDSLKTEAIKKD